MSRRTVFACLFLLVVGPVFAQQQSAYSESAHPDMKCTTCDPGGGGGSGGGGGTTPPKQPPATVTAFSVTPAGSVVQVQASNGVTLSINLANNTATVSNGRVSTQMTASQAFLAAVNNDPTLAAQMQARFQALLANPKKTTLLVKNGTVVSSAIRAGVQGMAAAQSRITPNLYPGPGEDGFSCDFDYACDRMQDNDFGGSGSYYFDYWDSLAANGNTATPDYNYWNHMRQEHCDKTSSEVAGIVGSGTLTLAACATAETGVGLAACAGSYVLLADTLGSYSDDRRICNSVYPGPGNW
jgi:hypothetical protein